MAPERTADAHPFAPDGDPIEQHRDTRMSSSDDAGLLTSGTETRDVRRGDSLPQVVWVEDLDGFLALEEEWGALARDEPSAGLTHAWMRCWWATFGAGRPRVCTVRRDGRLTGVLPLRSRRGVLSGWSNEETDTLRPLAETAADLEAIVDAVVRTAWSRLNLRGLPEGDPATRLLRERAGAVALTMLDPFRDSPVIETSGTLEDYRAAMSRNTRQRVGKHRRRLEREHDVRLTLLERPQDPLARLDEALRLEASTWKGRAGSAVLSSEKRTAFYRDVAQTFAQDGTFRVSELRVDGRLAAFDVALLRGGHVASLITSYDESLGSYSPGLVLRMAIVEACFEQGLAANDLLGTMLEWKTKFATGSRPTQTLRVYRRRPGPVARYGLRALVWPAIKPRYARLRELRRRRAKRQSTPS
jgi:CelD/BcsL family acetyltransferase involved in cellulose biosynthesis